MKIWYLLRNFDSCAELGKSSKSYQIFHRFRFWWKTERPGNIADFRAAKIRASILRTVPAIRDFWIQVYLPTLTPAGWKLRSHACEPISHAWLKNVGCYPLAWHNFQKYVNSDPCICKERKPCVKWINDNTLLAISDFMDKRFLDNLVFGRLRTSSEDFRLIGESSEMIVSSSKIWALQG